MRIRTVIVAAVAFSLATSAIALALPGIPGPDELIHACYANNNGDLRVISFNSACNTPETAIAWPSQPYVDQGDASTLAAANVYTDQRISSANAYTDSALASEAAARMSGDASTLQASQQYTDQKVAGMGSCAAGAFATGVDSAGHVTCVTDKIYSGTDFAVSNQSCAVGQVVKAVSASGALQCVAPQQGTLTTFRVDGPSNTMCSIADPTCSNFASSTADCPAGSVVTGGGYHTSAQAANVDKSRQAGNSWFVSAYNQDFFLGGHVQAFATCLRLLP